MRKEIQQVLDFQEFAFFRNLSATFPQTVKRLIFNAFKHA
jgi:hypothetical protein